MKRFVVFALAAFAVPLLHFRKTLGHDWDYFNSLSWLVRTNLLHYQQLAVYDPWGCGGLDVWANPQHRMLSPLGLLDLALPPHLANLFGLIIHAAFGAAGAYALFRQLKVNHTAALVCAFLFIDGSWFGLHYSVGHIPFGGMQLLPWAGLFALRFSEARVQLLTALLFAFFILDGAIYALIFSVYLMLTLWAIHGLPSFDKRLWILGIGVLATAAVKAVPLLAATGPGPIRTDASRVGPGLFMRMFFDPRQFSGEEYLFEHLRFHEFGCYIGLPLLGLLVWGRRHVRTYAVALVIWLWAATAWLTPFNPWQLHRWIPFVNTAHVQSRALLIVYLLLLVAAGLALTQLRNPRWLLALLVCESIAIRTYTWEQSFRAYPRDPLPLSAIAKTNVTHTLPSSLKPEQYQEPDAGVHNCYEPSLKHEGRLAVSTDMADYRGEAWVFGPEVGPPEGPGGSAEVTRHVPGEITVRYALQGVPPAIIVLNARANGGWTGADMIAHERIAFRVHQPSGVVTLRYEPRYRPIQIASGVLALLAFCAGAWLCRSHVAERASKKAEPVTA